MYAIKYYMYKHKQDCEFFGWPTLLSMCASIYACAPLCVGVCPCVHRGDCLAPVVF